MRIGREAEAAGAAVGFFLSQSGGSPENKGVKFLEYAKKRKRVRNSMRRKGIEFGTGDVSIGRLNSLLRPLPMLLNLIAKELEGGGG